MANDVPSGAPVVNAAGITDTGRVRPINEDAFSYQQPTDPNEAATKGNLYVVTDGMGGMNAGDLASEVAVESITQNYYASDATNPREALEEAVQIANGRVLSEALNRNMREKMGATVVALVLQDAHYIVANAGNSRGYLVRDGTIKQLTVDHSWAAEKLAQGMSREQIQADPRRNAVTRALGIKQEVRVDFSEGQTQAGDIFILCTDGLTGAIGDETIKDIVVSNPPNIAVDRLKQAAIDANTSDNIAVLVADVESVPGGAAVAPAEAAGAAGATLAATQAQDGNAVQESVPAVPRPRNRQRTSGQQAAVAGAAAAGAAGAELAAANADTGDTGHSKVKSKTKTSGQQAVVAAAPAATQTGGTGEPADGNEPDTENEDTGEEEATESRGGVSPWLLIAAVIIVGILLGLVIRGIFFPQQAPGSPVVGGIVGSPTVKGALPGATTGAKSPVAGQATTPGAQATQPAGVPTTTVAAPAGPAATATPAAAGPGGQPTAAPSPTPSQAAPPANNPPPPAAPTPTTAAPAAPPPAAPTATPTPQKFAIIAATSGGGVNIRQQPTTASAVIGSIPNGARVAIITTVPGQALAPNNPNWYQVSYNGVTGYIYSNTVRLEQ